MEIQFLGGAGTVTGSKTLIKTDELSILVDCGQFQGIKTLRERNWQPLPVSPPTIDFVLLTHGHLDHCGWLPRLVAQGFKGKIICTAATKEITKLILLDSAKIQEEEAERANKSNFSIHKPAVPLYDVSQAEKVFAHFQIIPINECIALKGSATAVYTNAGHILGACTISIEIEGKTLVFSGDIGRDDDVLMFPPCRPKKADYVFLESTYGNRIHPHTDAKSELENYINDTILKKGTVIIPGFAVERAQSVMYLIWQLKKEGKIPNVPYILDTPMGISVLQLFRSNTLWHKLSPGDCREMCAMFTLISNYSDTIRTIYNDEPKVVIAASGMLTGGRVLSYLEHYIETPQTTVIMVGYQAEGTRGKKLLEGANEIKIYGRFFSVNARVVEIKGLSAHADQNGLLHWLSELQDSPKKVFLIHGENAAADELRIKINQKYGFSCQVPLLNDTISL